MSAYGQVSPATVGVIMRKLLELEQQGADRFFGEKSFEVEDLLRKDGERGYINVVRLCDMQDKPKLFSTFMLCLLAEVYAKFPEMGDKAAPKLVIFIDEAHLIFREATKTLLNQLETVIKLIRSKGVGIYFALRFREIFRMKYSVSLVQNSSMPCVPLLPRTEKISNLSRKITLQLHSTTLKHCLPN